MAEHEADQLTRGRRAVDWPTETFVNQVRKVPAVIHVGVTENDGVHFGCAEGEMARGWMGAQRMATEDAAVEQDFTVSGLDQMH
jgi:hypothetical protein